MSHKNRWFRFPLAGLAAVALLVLAWPGRPTPAEAAQSTPTAAPNAAFDQQVKPFLNQYCQKCHNVDSAVAGVRVDQLDASLDDKHIRVWEGIRHRVNDGTMPPKGLPQPDAAARKSIVAWIDSNLEIARLRPAPKNGLVRRLTVAQYRNTLRELLNLEDDLTEILPPDALSREGFLNHKDALQLSPLLMETYLEIAEEALNRSIVDPKVPPQVQNFRVDLGAGINPAPLHEELILGANSHLLENKDVLVTQLTAPKPFRIEPFFMQTKYRFIEGYQGNDTVRGWREYDSIYHSVFACMRGSMGYPKGRAYSTVPEGLLLRPAIPNEEMFDGDGTYGPKANFKISLRELPDNGRFRVTVTAARYNDGLLLDNGAAALDLPESITARDLTARGLTAKRTVNVPKAGLYQVDLYPAARPAPPSPDASRLNEALAASWLVDGTNQLEGQLKGKAQVTQSPLGPALSFTEDNDAAVIPRDGTVSVGTGDFTVAAWINPKQLRRAGIVSSGGYGYVQGWTFAMAGNNGALRLETLGPDYLTNGVITSQAGVLRENAWQHVAAVIRRGQKEAWLYVDGYAVAKGEVRAENLDNPKLDLHLGQVSNGASFRGDLGQVRLYRRALGEAEIQALVEPGRRFAQAPPPEKPQSLVLTLGAREFSGTLQQPAFVALRLPAGPLEISARYGGVTPLDRVVLTPLDPAGDTTKRLLAFEKRAPKLGVQVGLRRDCGSTFSPVGAPQTVAADKLTRYFFEGAIRNFPSPDVEKDNVNYLAGFREIAVRSEFTDGRDMPRMLVRSVEFEGPFYQSWPPPPHKSIFIESTQKPDSPAYAREILRSFATRAYRRPVTAMEEASLMAIFEKSFAASHNFRGAIKDALQVVLTSPQFLLLVESSKTPEPEPVSDYELASKLSYFLWNGPPDRATLRLAAAGTLRSQLDAEITRLMADSRFSRFVQEFASQWLSTDKFQVLEPDRKQFPKLTRYAKTQLRQEPVEFVRYLMKQNLPVRNLIDSDFVIANETVANYYDLGTKTESGLDFVAIPHGRRELGGVLTTAAIMAGLSDGRESNPVKRGAWLARKIISEPPADPPPNVPALKESAGLTLRQRIEQHRDNPGCRQCHAKIDPWGIAFEEFDAGGRLKTKKVDARSTLPDNTEVAGIDDLKRYLGQDRIDQVAFSVLKHLATYASGRSLTYQESSFLKQDSQKLRAQGYRMQDLIRYVVQSKTFLEK